MKKLYSVLALGTLMMSASISSAQTVERDSLRAYSSEDVLVYSTRIPMPLKNLPAKIEVLPAKTIDHSSYNNLGEILKMNSSIDLIQYNGYNTVVGMRGFTPSLSGKYVNILVDGLPIGTHNISALNLGDVAQVEVLKGPFSSIYGTNTMGGVINLIMKEHKGELTGQSSVSLGSYQSSRGSFSVGGGLTNGINFDFNINYDNQAQAYRTGKTNLLKMTEAEQAILDPTTQYSKFAGTDYGVGTGRLRVGFEISPNWSFNIYENLFWGAGIKTGGSIWGVYGNSKKDLYRSSTSAKLEGKMGRHTLSFKPYYNIEKSNNYGSDADDAFSTYKGTYETYGGLLQDNFTIGKQHFLIGLDSRNMKNATRSFSSETVESAPYQPAYKTNDLGIYAQTSLSFLNERINLSAGARYDLMKAVLEANTFLNNQEKEETYNVFSPNLGLQFKLTEQFKLHSNFGIAFTAPDAFQKAGSYTNSWGTKTIGNPDLKPETSRTIDVGLGYNNYKAGLQVDVTYFNTRHNDLIVSQQDKASNTQTYINANKARKSGIEAVVLYDFGALFNHSFYLAASMNGTFMIDNELQIDANKDEWSDIYYVRKQNVSFGLDFKNYKGLEIGLKGRYMGKRLEQNWYGFYKDVRPNLGKVLAADKDQADLAAKGLLRYPAFLTFDASVYYNINRHFTVGLNANNILDENYAEKDGYNLAGRNYMFKTIYRF